MWSHIGGAAAAIIAFAAFAPIAVAQEATATWTCQDVGPIDQTEKLGDREGHSLSVGQYSCRIDGGPLSGGIATGTDIWENDGPKSVRLSASGVIRKAGSVAVYSGGTGNYSQIVTDGKVTGWMASGTDKYVLGTGDWAPLAGKSETWTAKPSAGPGQFLVEHKFE
jgi:hypothetical protein